MTCLSLTNLYETSSNVFFENITLNRVTWFLCNFNGLPCVALLSWLVACFGCQFTGQSGNQTNGGGIVTRNLGTSFSTGTSVSIHDQLSSHMNFFSPTYRFPWNKRDFPFLFGYLFGGSIREVVIWTELCLDITGSHLPQQWINQLRAHKESTLK